MTAKMAKVGYTVDAKAQDSILKQSNNRIEEYLD